MRASLQARNYLPSLGGGGGGGGNDGVVVVVVVVVDVIDADFSAH